ncbi:MAG: tol-pal system YbgF family protein [Planctomycetota bacterium]|jgi:hypothetical protein
MGSLKRIAAAGVLLTAWICASGQTAGTPDQETPDSMYYVTTDYGWTMSSRESSGIYTLTTPLRLKMRISFYDLGDGRLKMQLHFHEVSYTDQRHKWTITDFSNPEEICKRFYAHWRKGPKLRHFTELAAFEEEALAYLMALSHGGTFTIDLSEDTVATFSNLSEQYKLLLVGNLEERKTALHAKYNHAVETRNRAAQKYDPSSRQYKRAVEQLQRAQQEYNRACMMYGARGALLGIGGYGVRLGTLWAQQIRHLAMFARRPAYKTLTPCNALLQVRRNVESRGSTDSPPENQTEVPAFSLCGLYRWLPMHQNLFARLDAVTSTKDGYYHAVGFGLAGQKLGAWLLTADKMHHTVEETLDETLSGRVKYRCMKVESRLDWVDAFAFLPNGSRRIPHNKGIRGTIKVAATTTLEATLVDSHISADRLFSAERLWGRIATRMKMKDHSAAVFLCETYLRLYPDTRLAGEIKQRLGELAAIRAEQDRKYPEHWTKLAELGLSNGRPDVAQKYLKKIISRYPETTWAANARQRLSDLPQVSIES